MHAGTVGRTLGRLVTDPQSRNTRGKPAVFVFAPWPVPLNIRYLEHFLRSNWHASYSSLHAKLWECQPENFA